MTLCFIDDRLYSMNVKNRGSELTRELVDKYEVSKYRIAKVCGVSWATVNLWYKGAFSPMPKTLKKLVMYYKTFK